MQRVSGRLGFSASDLVTFLGCRHASALNRRYFDEPWEMTRPSPSQKLLQDKGIAHELAYLEFLEDSGREVVRIPNRSDRVRLTLKALRDGADVIYQAALEDGAWYGESDFLVRTDTPSALGGWSYEAVDAKLAQQVSPRHVVQLSVYSSLLANIQDLRPARMSIVLGSGMTEVLRTDDFASYVTLAGRRMLEFHTGATMPPTKPEPCAQCALCRWRERCEDEWETADHLSLVANIRVTQAAKLRAAGVDTVAKLGVLPPGQRIPGMAPETLERLRSQARLQVSVRGTDGHRYELLPPQPGRDFSRMPKPAEGDLFFDMEGDPLYPGGLEYLFGVHWGDPAGGTFRAFWAHDREEERRALEEFLDFVRDHLALYPDAHIYHYNHYEPTVVRRLCMSHATREAILDDLLRRRKFVDLFKVVREALLISEPRYSLKNVEVFYREKREGEVANAGDSIVAYETWRATGWARLLTDIELYNAIDCRSTAELRDWLISIRPANTPWFDPAEAAPDEAAVERQKQAEAERLALEDALLTGVSKDEKPFRQVIVELAEFHRREQKPEWWALFDRQGRDEDELVDDADCLGGLTLVGEPVPEKSSLVHTYQFPLQETKLAVGHRPVIVDTLEPAGSIEHLDVDRGLVKLKRGANKGPLPPVISLGPGGPLDDQTLRGAVKRFADSIATGSGRFPAVERFLRREPPRLVGRKSGDPIIPDGADLVDGSIVAVAALDESYLFIQGPPGTGKTFTSAQVIVELLRRGKRIGVAANSHKAINNLLAGVEKAATERGVQFRGYKKATANNAETEFRGDMIEDVFDNEGVPPGSDLIAGTAWLFARPEFEKSVDYLFIDEAGQVSLANLVAMGTAARNIVLVGDQMQLGQPIKGSHPGESGGSALEYLLQGAATVPPDRGIFLDISWRMHPNLCGWVSEAIYDGRLKAHASLARQALLLDSDAHPALMSHGLRFVSVEHTGRSQRSPEEAETAKAIWENLMGQHWR